MLPNALKVGLSFSGRQEDRQFPCNRWVQAMFSVRCTGQNPLLQHTYPNGLPTTGIENNNPAVQVTDIGGV
jgi:hypothetical protein